MDYLEIKLTTDKGRGVFASSNFDLNEVIERCPLIIIPTEEERNIVKTGLKNYYFKLPDESIAIALGYGSLYNHKDKSNAKYILDAENKELIIQCIRRIKQGEEITINYNGRSKDKSNLWFDKK